MTAATAVRPGLVTTLRLGWRSARDYHAALEELARLGDVVDLGFGPLRYVYAFGADANETILSTHADRFLWGEFLQTLVPINGPTALVVTDGPEHDRRRRMVQPAFHRRRIDGYVSIMSAEVVRAIAGWSPGATVELHTELQQCIRRIIMRSLFGDAFAEQAQRFGDLVEPALDYVKRPVTARIDRRWFPPYRRAIAARDAADRLVFEEIARRRAAHAAGQPAGDDVLSWLLDARDGDVLTDAEVRDQVVSTVAAGYDTTAAGAAWLAHALYSRPDVLAALRDEIDRELPGHAPLDAVALQRMRWLDGIVSETLRLWPPGAVSGRTTVADVDICGCPIPPGRTVLYSAWITQRDPRWWPDPLRFEPGRWIEGHPAQQRIAPSSWVVFGGGARRCLGFAMAVTELKAIAVELARGVDLQVDPATPAPTGLVTTVPRGGVPAVVRPLA